jgi:hypothetical protein
VGNVTIQRVNGLIKSISKSHIPFAIIVGPLIIGIRVKHHIMKDMTYIYID